MITIPAEWWTLILATILPALVALIRSRWGSSQLGSLLLLGLSVLGAVATEVIVDSTGAASFSWADVGKRFVLLFVVAVAAHFGLLKPAGVTGSDGVIARAVPGGLGNNTPPPRHVYRPSVTFGGPEGKGPGDGG